jgi:Fuc2NAc and GlcNAc transferase
MIQTSFTSLFLCVSIFLLSLIVTHLVRRYALNHLLDIPNARSSHLQPTPRGGGLGIVIAFSVALIYLYIADAITSNLLFAFLLGMLISAIGFWDDHQHIAARWRFLVHFLVAMLALFFLPGFPEFYLASFKIDLGVAGYFCAAIFLVWTLNLFNFMDGIDGIAASEAVFVSAALAGFVYTSNPDLAWIGLTLASSCLGFLIWNWPAAKIFMGDVGSGFLGFILGLLILFSAHHEPVLIYTGLILFAVFIVDATYTLLCRYVNGAKWYQAHCSHAYQNLARHYCHLSVLLTVWAINLFWLLPMAYLAYHFFDYAWAILVLAYLPLIGVAFRFEAGIE